MTTETQAPEMTDAEVEMLFEEICLCPQCEGEVF